MQLYHRCHWVWRRLIQAGCSAAAEGASLHLRAPQRDRTPVPGIATSPALQPGADTRPVAAPRLASQHRLLPRQVLLRPVLQQHAPWRAWVQPAQQRLELRPEPPPPFLAQVPHRHRGWEQLGCSVYAGPPEVAEEAQGCRCQRPLQLLGAQAGAAPGGHRPPADQQQRTRTQRRTTMRACCRAVLEGHQSQEPVALVQMLVVLMPSMLRPKQLLLLQWCAPQRMRGADPA